MKRSALDAENGEPGRKRRRRRSDKGMQEAVAGVAKSGDEGPVATTSTAATSSTPPATIQEASQISLIESLPVELLWHIQILSRCPKLPTLSRRLHLAFSHTPTRVRVDYLLACWFDAYRGDLIPPGCFAGHNSAWCKGPFPPPQSWLNDPISTYERPSNDRPYIPPQRVLPPSLPPVDLFDYCLAFPLCTEQVFLALQASVLRRIGKFSNVVNLHHWDTSALAARDMHLTLVYVPLLPRRLLRSFVARDPNPSDPLFKAYRGLLGGPPYPRDLRFVARLLALHMRYPSDEHPNLDRFPLPRAVLERSTSFMKLLLGLGRQAKCDKGMAVRIAIRMGWLEGVRLLIEVGDEATRAHAFIHFVQEALVEGVWPFHWRDEAKPRPTRLAWPDDVRSWREDPSSGPFDGHTTFTSWINAGGARPSEASIPPHKRFKWPDRLTPTPEMLHEAVQCQAWDIVSYFRDDKGVVPKLRTLKLLGAG